MKKFTKPLLAFMLTVIAALTFAACGNNAKIPVQQSPEETSKTQETKNTAVDKTGLWQDALYLENTELGNGSKVITVEVKVENKAVKFTIHTDEKTVGEALFKNNLIKGENGPYGLYVKKVNGITADYDIDKSYWAFYIDGQYAATGVDKTEITEGAAYQIEYTK